jgi:uncharacterized protein YebE (UPF0316 family)
MTLFLVGAIEMMVAAAWTQSVSKSKIVASGIVTAVNVLIWFFVLKTVMECIDSWVVVVSYTLGCSIGTMLMSSLKFLPKKKIMNTICRIFH